MNRQCSTCKHVERMEDDDMTTLRCGSLLPFWVSLPIRDFRSWVFPADGCECPMWAARHKRVWDENIGGYVYVD